jgi:hypothetical protein
MRNFQILILQDNRLQEFPELIANTFSVSLSTPVTVKPAVAAVRANGRPT